MQLQALRISSKALFNDRRQAQINITKVEKATTTTTESFKGIFIINFIEGI